MLVFLKSYSNVIGIAGVLMVLSAYFLLQINRLRSDRFFFSLCNLIGSVLILVSLCYHFNLASFVIEVAWLGISFFGVLRCIIVSRRQSNMPSA